MFLVERPTIEAVTRSPVPLTLKPPAQPRRYAGLITSLALHLGLVAVLVSRGDRLFSRTLTPGASPRPDGASTGGGGGGPRVSYITLPPVTKPEAPAVPKARPVVPPVRPPVAPVPERKQPETVALEPVDTSAKPPAVATADSAPASGVGTGTGGASGPGQGAGGRGPATGVGDGGEGGRGRPPEPRDMAFPFDNPPKELRGISLNVTFWVRTDGVVERYTVEPEIKDRDYAKKFDEVMRAFRFSPAQAPDGTRIPGTTRISFTLPGKRSS